jgi:hypothetical protein
MRGRVAIVLGFAAMALFGFIIEGFAANVPVVTTKREPKGSKSRTERRPCSLRVPRNLSPR